MLYKWLISHQIKETTRSNFWQKQLILNIVIGFFILIMLLYLLLLGLFIDKVLLEIRPDDNPLDIFNGIILYYFGFELMMRFMMQNLPTVNIESYLHLPIKKSAIINFLNFKSLLAIGNYLPLLVFIPFGVKVIAVDYNGFVALIWILSMFFIALTNNFIAIYIKRQMTSKPMITGIAGLALIALILLDYFQLISFASISRFIFNGLLENPIGIVIPVIMLVGSYLLNFYFLKSKLYPEEIARKTEIASDSSKAFQYLRQYGHMGQLIIKDIKLIWRHKRTRSIVYMAPLFLGYGFFFYPNPVYNDKTGFLIFVGIFMVGGMMLNYLNYAFSYESAHFDFILSNYKDFDQYLRQKFLFGVVISTISYVLTIPYLFFDLKILFINTMCWFYNVGVLSYLLLYTATFSKKRMDLSKGAAFNYQGMGASHWFSMIPFFLLPLLFYWPFSAAGYPTGGFILIGGMGFMGLILYKPLMQIVKKKFLAKKYEMATGFRSDF
jgi:hypothetical protein